MHSTIFECLPECGNAGELAQPAAKTFTQHFQAHAPYYGLNTATLLSPEPLNQYSRIAMLFDLLPAAPYKVAPQIFAWEPLDYAAYFAASRHPARDFIAAAWRYAPDAPKTRFADALEILHRSSVNAVSALRLTIAHGRVHEARALCGASAQAIRDTAEAARAIADES